MKQATRLGLLLVAVVSLAQAATLKNARNGGVQKQKKDEQFVQCNIPDWTGGECEACRSP